MAAIIKRDLLLLACYLITKAICIFTAKYTIMLQAATLTFMTNIAGNNNKPWFDDHRDEYLAVKADFEQLVGEVLSLMAEKDAGYKEVMAKDCIMRIFKDVRFAKDKTPYKTNLGAGISKGGKKMTGAGYYLHIQPGNQSFAGGGIWMPEAPVLKKIRQEIDYNYTDFAAIVENPDFKKRFGGIEGEELKKLPQGYSIDNPAIAYLKKKSFTVGAAIADEQLTHQGLAKTIATSFAAMTPLIDFLNKAVG
jgi:uncharacterized protein (TIGR02453 family)